MRYNEIIESLTDDELFSDNKVVVDGKFIGHIETDDEGDPVGIVFNPLDNDRPWEIYGYNNLKHLKQEMLSMYNQRVKKTVAEDDDDDLFGRGLHHRIAEVLRAQAEEDQRIADEERGLGDLRHAAEFEEQARNYRYIADAFNHSMATGAQVYRSLDRSWRHAVDDVVDMELDLDFRDYVKQLPESAEDDDLFSTSDKLNRRHQLRAKTIRRIEKRDALNIQPGTRLMVKWDNGKYYKGTVARLTRGGRVVVQVKFRNVDWPLEKNISPRDIKPEHILSESADDDELFSSGSKHQVLDLISAYEHQLPERYRGYGKDYIEDILEDIQDIKILINRDLMQGLDRLSELTMDEVWAEQIWELLKSNMQLDWKPSWMREDDNDDELFGKQDSARLALILLRRLQVAQKQDPDGVSNLLKQYNNDNSTQEQRAQYVRDFMAQAVGMPPGVFENYAEDFYFLPWDVNFHSRPWQAWDAKTLKKAINTMSRIVNIPINENNDDELFGKSSDLADIRKEKIKQIMDPYLRTIGKIRELAKTKYGAKIRVSGAPKKSARGRATVWIGDYDSNYQIPKTNPEAFEVKKDLEQMGFECRFTDAGWLSVRVPPAFSNLISEDADDDELFGKTTLVDRIRDLLLHRQKVRVAVSGAMGWVRGMRDGDVIISRSPRSTTRYLWPGLHSERAKNFELIQDPATRIWSVIDRADLDESKYTEDAGDDELFGSDGSGMKGIIYRTGKQMLSRLEHSWNDPHVRSEYKEYLEADDSDAMFSLVLRNTGIKPRQAFVIDTIIREFAGREGLNDFGWMLESGEFQDLVNAWERFRADQDIENEEWFQREIQDFKGSR